MSRRPDRPRIFYTGISLLGVASGLRSQIGVASVCATVPSHSLPRILRSRLARRATGFLAAGELVADKLPFTPDRTQPPGLAARLVLGGLAGALAARGMGYEGGKAARIGAGTALIGSFGGLSARRKLAVRFPAVGAGLIEDGAAVLLAIVGARAARS